MNAVAIPASGLTAEQKALRRTGLGGSDCAAALGLSKRKTALQLYLEKRGELSDELEDNEFLWWGRMLEPVVRQKYAERTGRTVMLPKSTLQHPDHKFMFANIDGFSTERSTMRGYEGKTALLSTGWGEEGTDEIPIDYLMQTHHYMVVTGFPVFDVTTLIGRKFAFYEVAADKELAEMIVAGESEFMRRVREGDPPPLDFGHKTALDVVKKVYRGTNGATVIASVDACQWREQMELATKKESDAKKLKDEMKARLLDRMGEAAVLKFPDGKFFRRKLILKEAFRVDSTEYWDARIVKNLK